MGATEMGQLAMEYLDDRKFEFSKLEKEIKANMKERERTLKLARREVAFLTDSFPNLIRKEVCCRNSLLAFFMYRPAKVTILPDGKHKQNQIEYRWWPSHVSALLFTGYKRKVILCSPLFL